MDNQLNSIVVQDFDQNPVDLLSIYKNQNLLLLLYNNQCLGCTGRAVPLAYKLQNMHKNVTVIGIHSNFGTQTTSEEDIKSIFTSKELPFPIYLDETHEIYDFFQSEGTPQWVLITKDKTVYRSVFGSQANAENRLLYALESLD
ncbi:redoxin domain-containing protein [Mangrovimonas sp. AS39]|uniref:TlpA family protein disulfide reductase n=1 Tax=Mangrovimonas futianensis TaxID=2895523 RepID=UPI001E598EC5|nr:redoxin domain-containing protein [Mangrovimonas futianensis]MCF1190727.1 redoxin domain-containing protein [Mangrovimonas futianensis]MCF1194424.1 redoxin domain-containing protein [Mangrovimonas futianensis]